MMYHFFLTIDDQTTPMSAPVLPRTGDSIVVNGVEHLIDKVVWLGHGQQIDERPVISTVSNIYPNHSLAARPDIESMATRLARTLPQRKIQAIKDLRATFNLGLKEAKEMMDVAYAEEERRVREWRNAYESGTGEP